MHIQPFILTCNSRKLVLQDTLNNFNNTDWPKNNQPILIEDKNNFPDKKHSIVTNTYNLFNESMKYNFDYLFFMEDDLIFNKNIYHNLINWNPIKYEYLLMGSLYNPGIEGFCNSGDSVVSYSHFCLTDMHKMYGNQALVFNKKAIIFLLENWDSVQAPSDIKISRILSNLCRTYFIYHPNLVDHQRVKSTWDSNNYKHTCKYFSIDFKL